MVFNWCYSHIFYVIFRSKGKEVENASSPPYKIIKVESDDEMDPIPLEYGNFIKEEPKVKIETAADEPTLLKILVKNEVYEESFDTAPESGTEISIDKNDTGKGIVQFLNSDTNASTYFS